MERNRALLTNATSLVGSVGIASGLGFVYWAVAAKVFSPEAVGSGSAATSAMTLLGTVGMFGLGPMLMGELPRRRVRGPLVAASLIATGIGSLVLAIGFALIAPHFGSGFGYAAGGLAVVAMFIAGVVMTGVSKTFDQACIGVLQGGLQLTRNLVFSVAKVVALPLSAIMMHGAFGVGISFSWVIGTAVSLAWSAVQLKHNGVSVTPRPDWKSLRRLGKTTMAHNWLNLALFVPPTLIPVLVTALVSSEANASFYVAWMIANFLYIIPASLSTVLFAVASADAAAMAGKLRFTMRVSLYLGAPGMLVLFVGGHLLLSVFGQSYAANGTIPLWLFAAAYLPSIPVSHYIAVCRTTDRIGLAAAVLTTSSAVQCGAAAAGGVWGGLTGLSVALVAVKFLEGFVTLPAVLRAMREKRVGSHSAESELRVTRADLLSQAVLGVSSSGALDDTQAGRSGVDRLTKRQLDGVAALIAISMADGAATGSFPAIPPYDDRLAYGDRGPSQSRHVRVGQHRHSSANVRYVPDGGRPPKGCPPSAGGSLPSGGYPVNDGYPANRGYPVGGGSLSNGRYPVSGERSPNGGYPVDGGYPVNDGHLADGGYSVNGSHLVNGGYPVDSRSPVDGGYPVDGRSAASDPYPLPYDREEIVEYQRYDGFHDGHRSGR